MLEEGRVGNTPTTDDGELTAWHEAQSSHQRSQLTRGLRVLDVLREHPCTVPELARVLEVNRSTSHRLLHELELAGYVAREPKGRAFVLAKDKLLAFRTAPDQEVNDRGGGEWGEAIYRVLGQLRDIVGESTVFAVPAHDRMLYVAFFPADDTPGEEESVGSRRPMHASAIGKAHLSALAPTMLDLVSGRLSFDGGTELAAKGPGQLRDMLGDVRRLGYAIDRDETLPGWSCVATPVFVNEGTLVGAAGISGLTSKLSDKRLRAFGELLVNNTRHLLAS
jgi:DNA-binding IclR family transcriptional regulator